MRTTVDLDEDVLRAAQDLAAQRGHSLGRVLSELARRGLQPRQVSSAKSHGVPILARLPGAKPVTSGTVKDLLELG